MTCWTKQPLICNIHHRLNYRSKIMGYDCCPIAWLSPDVIVRWDYCPKPNYYTYQATKTRRYNHTTTLLCGGPHIVSILMIDITKSCLLRIALHPSPRMLPAGLRESQPCRYCFYSAVQKWGFRTAEATRCPDKREIWHGGADRRSPVPNTQWRHFAWGCEPGTPSPSQIL